MLPLVLELPQATQGGDSLPNLGKRHEGECGQGEVLELYLQDEKQDSVAGQVGGRAREETGPSGEW